MILEKTKCVRIDEDDYEGLRKIKDATGIPIVKLVHFSVPLLKRKYRIKDVSDGDKL